MNKKLLLCMTFVMLCVCSYAQKADIGGISYSVKKGEAAVERIDATLEDVLIPEQVEIKGKNYPVTLIRKGLFTGRTPTIAYFSLLGYAAMAAKSATRKGEMAKVALRTLSIPNSVKKIESKAFAGCGYLYSIKVPDTPIQIATDAFDDCKMITEVSCQNGSYPKDALVAIPAECSFMIAQGKSQPSAAPQPAALAQAPVQQSAPAPTAVAKSDVDVNIPAAKKANDNTFAIIIGNENYQHVASVPFANNDTRTIAEYCKKSLGLPESNVRLYENATYGTMLSAMTDIKQIATAYNGDINVIFYYAGHGIPNESSHDAYLLPIDADGQQMEVCYPLSRLYKELGALGAKNIVVFMDACFSGAARGEGMLASARGVALKAKEEKPQGNMVVFSAASGDETAFPYKEKSHGLFTYFLLKKLQETKGECTLGELGTYVQQKVKQQSVVVNRKSQTPTVISSQSLQDSWQQLKLAFK